MLTAREAQTEKKFEGFAPRLEPVTDEMNRDGKRILLPLLGAAALVLLIACGNAAALLLLRGLQRQQEYAVRSAMGMGRIALLRQVLMESLLLALFGGVFGVGLAVGAVKLFKVIAGHAVPRLDGVTVGWAVLGWGLGAAVLAAFFAGVVPALRAFRLDPMEVLKNAGPKGTAGVGERRLLRGVTMLQTALTLALLVGAGLLIRTMMKIAGVPSGYNTGRILTMSVTEVQDRSHWGSFHRQALERVAAIPGVQYAAFAWGVPLTGNNWPATLEIEGQPPAVKESDKTALPLRAVTPDYFKLMGMPLMEGREFRSADDDKAPKVAIVNQAFADRYFPHGNAIGRKFWLSGRDKPGTEIVGEIANGRTDDLTQEASPEIYLPLWQATRVFKTSCSADNGGSARSGGCSGTRTALRGSNRGDRKREDAGADSRRIAGVANVRDESADRVFGSGKRIDAGGNLRRALAVGGLPTQGVGNSQCGGRATKRHSQVDLRRRISVDSRWRTRRHSAGDCVVTSAEVFSVRSAAQRSCDVNHCGSFVHRGRAPGVLGPGAAGGEGRSAGSITVRLNRGCFDHAAVHVDTRYLQMDVRKVVHLDLAAFYATVKGAFSGTQIRGLRGGGALGTADVTVFFTEAAI